jgi:hypothetical protein
MVFVGRGVYTHVHDQTHDANDKISEDDTQLLAFNFLRGKETFGDNAYSNDGLAASKYIERLGNSSVDYYDAPGFTGATMKSDDGKNIGITNGSPLSAAKYSRVAIYVHLQVRAKGSDGIGGTIDLKEILIGVSDGRTWSEDKKETDEMRRLTKDPPYSIKDGRVVFPTTKTWNHP